MLCQFLLYSKMIQLYIYIQPLFFGYLSHLGHHRAFTIFIYLFIFNKFIYLFVFLFLAVLGLCCCVWALSNCGKQGLLFFVVHGLLIVVASVVVEHGLQARGLQYLWLIGSRAQAQQLWFTGLVAPRHVGSSQTRDGTCVPALAGR